MGKIRCQAANRGTATSYASGTNIAHNVPVGKTILGIVISKKSGFWLEYLWWDTTNFKLYHDQAGTVDFTYAVLYDEG